MFYEDKLNEMSMEIRDLQQQIQNSPDHSQEVEKLRYQLQEMAPKVQISGQILAIRENLELTHQAQVQKLKGRNDILEHKNTENLQVIVKSKDRIVNLEKQLAEERLKKTKLAEKYRNYE